MSLEPVQRGGHIPPQRPENSEKPLKKRASDAPAPEAAVQRPKTEDQAPHAERVDPQALARASEKIKSIQQQVKLREEITALETSLTQARQDLKHLGQEDWATRVAGSDGWSFWQRLDVTEKARQINHLKEEIGKMETERSLRVRELADQIRMGTYQVSGAEILAGMLDEWV